MSSSFEDKFAGLEKLQEPTLPNGLRTLPKIPQHTIDWSDRQFTEEELAEGIRDIMEMGGHSLSDFYRELDPQTES